jgi:thiamine monophosphate kinase
LDEANVEEEYKESLRKRREEVLRVKTLDEATSQAELKEMAVNLKNVVKTLDSLIEKTSFPKEMSAENFGWLNGKN